MLVHSITSGVSSEFSRVCFAVSTDKPATPCAAQLTAMLACWATAGSSEMQDSVCADAAKALHDCMRLAVRAKLHSLARRSH